MRCQPKLMLAFCVTLAVVPAAGNAAESDAALLKQAQELFAKLPADFSDAAHPITPERVALGKALFFDPRWSIDGHISCATCHNPALYGVDGLSRSMGVLGRVHPRNAPTVLNSAGDAVVHWRADRKDIEDQAILAAIGAVSSGHSDHAGWIAKVKAIDGYAAMFQRAFPKEQDPITSANLGLAIGAYERTLVSRASFDSYLDGNVAALTPEAQAGLNTFIEIGCTGCHNGAGVGGAMLQKFGLQQDYWTATGSKTVDKGRFDITGDQNDLYVFKVPSLRNVAMTAPYFHDGSVASLPDAVRVMAKVQLGRTLADKDVRDIVAFLNALTGELPKDFALAPVVPPNASAAQALPKP